MWSDQEPEKVRGRWKGTDNSYLKVEVINVSREVKANLRLIRQSD